MKVAVIILNWNGASDTVECVKSVLHQRYDGDLDIFILDNNSTSNDEIVLRSEFEKNPKVKFRWYEKNHGFGVAHNLIFEELSQTNEYEYWALINNDAIAQYNWLAAGIPSIEHLNADVLACKMLNYYNRDVIDSAGLVMLNTGEILPRGHGLDKNRYTRWKKVISFCAGGCIIKPSVYKEYGGFDTFFQTGYEDAEWGLRLYIAGLRIIYEPRSLIYHKVSSSVNKIANKERAIKIQQDVQYTVFKLLPASVILINFIWYVPRTIALLLLHIFTFRFTYVHIWFIAMYRFITTDLAIARSKKVQFRRSSIAILSKQRNFILMDIKRFYKYFLNRAEHQFEKMSR